MRNLSKKLLLFLLIFALSFSGCRSKSKVSNGSNLSETGSNSWIVADTLPVSLPSATPRHNGSDDWRDEIIYFLMTDRFSDGDSSNNQPFYNKANINYYHGGDLQGIINQIGYLRSLGVTAVWITPVVENVWQDPHYTDYTGYHGYWAYDFTKLDPHLGPNNDYYQQFIDIMHDNGILVIQDIVTNHLGPLAYYEEGWTPPYQVSGYTRKFVGNYNSGHAELLKAPFNELNAFHNYGLINNYEDSIQCTTGDLSDLPDLKTEADEVRKALTDAYRMWASLGVDGFRIDTAKHVEMDFWQYFCPKIRAEVGGENFLQFGEVWNGSHSVLAKYVGNTGFDSVLNYDLYYVMRTVFGNVKDAYHTNATRELTEELERRNNSYSPASASELLVNFIDNHDNNRFLTDANGSLDRLWMSLTYLMTTKGIPCIYYNTENNIQGDTNTGRKDLPDFAVTNKRTFTLIRVLSKIRQENEALRRGTIDVLKDSDSAGIFAFVRSLSNDDPSENVLVLLNTSGQTINETIEVSGYASDGAELKNILATEFGLAESVTVANGSVTVSIPAYSMKIFKKL